MWVPLIVFDFLHKYHCWLAEVCVLSWSQTLSLIQYVDDDGYVFIWSLPETQFTHKFHAGQGPIVALEWFDYPNSADVRHLVSAGADGTIKLWKISNYQVR